MKIAFLIKVLNPCSSSRAPIELAKKLSRHHQIILFAYKTQLDQECQKKLEKLGIKVILFNDSLSLLKQLKAFQPEILSFHATLPFFIGAKLSQIPLIKTYYGTQLNAYLERLIPGQKPSLSHRFLNFLANQYLIASEKIQFKLATEMIAISQYTSQEAKKLYHREIPFVYLGANSEPFKKKKQPKKTHPFTILSVSRITPYKGFHLLIQVVNEVQKKINLPLKLIIVGLAEKKNYLKYLNQIKTPDTKILLNLSNEKLAQLYQSCDLYATCDRYLFFGLPPLETALFGKPTLALDFCAASEIIIHGKTGLVAKNLNQFKKFLVQLIQDKSLRERLGQNAKKRVKKEFNWEKTTRTYEKIFKKRCIS